MTELLPRLVAWIVDEGRAPASGVVALGALDLDHLGAEIGQGLADPRAGENARQLDHLKSGQR
jgi:hypothetical protein